MPNLIYSIVYLTIRTNDMRTCCYMGTEQRESQRSSFQLKGLLKDQLKGLNKALQSVPTRGKAVELLVSCQASLRTVTLLSAGKLQWVVPSPERPSYSLNKTASVNSMKNSQLKSLSLLSAPFHT